MRRPDSRLPDAGTGRNRAADVAPTVNAKTKREVAGLPYGTEGSWTDQGWSSRRATGLDHYRFVVFKDPAWEIDRFNVESDISRIDEGEARPSTRTIQT